MMEKLIAFDLKADFGFLRKPDTNDGISMSYNMLHKPCLLGIFGAILGYGGYQRRGELPEYYRKLKDLKIGVAPLNHQKGNFPKTTITYTNTVGYANRDGNFIAHENTLIKPSFTIYVALSLESPLYHLLRSSRAEYIPYLGKNEFPIWWENFHELDIRPFEFNTNFEIKSLFIKEDTVSNKENERTSAGSMEWFSTVKNSFFFFERLPIGFQEFKTKRGKEYQYRLAAFAYSNAKFQKEMKIRNLYDIGTGKAVQLN